MRRSIQPRSERTSRYFRPWVKRRHCRENGNGSASRGPPKAGASRHRRQPGHGRLRRIMVMVNYSNEHYLRRGPTGNAFHAPCFPDTLVAPPILGGDEHRTKLEDSTKPERGYIERFVDRHGKWPQLPPRTTGIQLQWGEEQ